MAMKEKFEQHTADIRAEVVKLSELGDREGLYVWKKQEAGTATVENPTVYITGELSTGATVASNDVDLNTLTDEFFNGFSYVAASGYSFSYTDGQLYYVAGGTSKEAYYDNVSHTLRIPSTAGSFSGDGAFAYSGTKTWNYISSETNYVVSDDETAYPDGGKLDDYWYERIGSDKLTLHEASVTGSSTNSFSIANPFGSKDKVSFALAFHGSSSNNPTLFHWCKEYNLYATGGTAGGKVTGSRTDGQYVSVTDETITFNITKLYVAATWVIFIGGVE